ncbi:MAG TPA: hydantoinase [Chloroflexi bacterium]|nr:hydantoinase [Chloroflexota bacterium]
MRLGCDIGGTFTDFVLLDDEAGEMHVYKCLTTPGDPSDAVEEGVQALAGRVPNLAARLQEVIHGTTLVINAIIERKGAATALLTTAGFRDVLELGREIRYAPYDLFAAFPEPLVPRHRRLEVEERVRADGKILIPLAAEEARAVVRSLAGLGVESVAVCLLNSFENPAHELLLKQIVQEELPDVSLSISYEVLPQIREYERTSTTVANAYVKPLVERYLRRLSHRLAGLGFDGRLFIMLSSGGVTSVETAAEFPVRIIESGPTAAVIAGEYFSRLFGLPEMFCFDMGGTTAKSCLIQNGRAEVAPTFEVGRVQRFMKGSGLTIQVPVVDLMEIGAGGGSIAHISRLGTLQVGPESASAAPGPICYSRGGARPTVTDADLLLGYLDPDYFLGGRMSLDTKRAREAVARHIADPLGLDVIEAASGIHRIVNENMASAARVHLTERGKNAADYPLFAFGGAGPVHAYGVAAAVGAPGIVVPFGAGVMSALGFLTAPLSFEFVQSWYGLLGRLDWAQVGGFLQKMEREGRELLQKAGVPGSAIGVERWCDIRYHGQGFDVKILLPDGALGEDSVAEIRRRFEERYRELYGRTIPGVEFEAVNWRVIVQGPKPDLSIAPSVAEGASVDAARKSARQAYFAEAGGFVETPVFDRYRLAPGAILTGPAIVEEHEATTIIGPGASATIDRMLNLVIHL